MELDEPESFREDLKLWKTADPQGDSIPPLVVETYLDLRGLGPEHSLILTDPSGKPYEVTKGTKRNEVMLERWIIEFLPTVADSKDLDWDDPAKESQPTSIYKQAVVLMRSLYSHTRLLPVWSLRKKLSRSKLTVSPLKVGCRILNGAHRIPSKGRIGLTKQIKELGESELEAFTFSDVTTPLGNLRISVSYRYECNFSVSDMESALSNHFYDLDKSRNAAVARRQSFSTAPFNSSSLPSPSRSLEGSKNMASRISAYRNHTKHASANSPSDFPSDTISTANATSSPTEYMARDRRLSNLNLRDSAIYSSLLNQPSTGTTGTPSVGSIPSSQSPTSTRPSVLFIQPFKTPSLSASPSDTSNIGIPNTATSRPTSFSRTTSNGSLAASLRIPARTMSNTSTSSANSYVRGLGSAGIISDNAISSSISSSRSSSIPKFSSSFGSRGSNWQRSGSISSVTRPKRLSNPGEAPSSIGSSSSMTEPGASFLVDDDDGLGEFVQMVDSISMAKPTSSNSVLLSGGSSGSGSSLLFGSNSRNIVNSSYLGASGTESDVLSKFQNMRGSYSALSDSLLGSQHRCLERSETSPGSSTSPHANQSACPIPTSSPPLVAKAVSQHTPSVPSRLSEEFTANGSFKAYYYSHPRKQGSRSSLKVEEGVFINEGDESEQSPGASRINPLDIPLPSSLTRHGRRESLSVSNRHTSGFKDMQDGITTSHHQSLDAPGHIFPGKELSSFRSNPSNKPAESDDTNVAPLQRRPSGIVALRATDRAYSTSPIDSITSQVHQVDLNYQSEVHQPEGIPAEGTTDYPRRSRFSYYTQDDDDNEERDKPAHGGSSESLIEDDDELIFAMNEGEGDGSPPQSSRYQGTSTNRFEALSRGD